MVKPKTGPKISGMNERKLGNNVDIVDETGPKENPRNSQDFKFRKKAVAIKDRRQGSAMPSVVASGHGTFAEQILQIAWANNIKVREDADLVEILAAIDVDSEIPIEAFAAVTEILAYVYRVNSGEITIDDLEETEQ